MEKHAAGLAWKFKYYFNVVKNTAELKEFRKYHLTVFREEHLSSHLPHDLISSV